MPRRGLIVAIESYPSMEDTFNVSLPGTHDDAAAFRRWLIESQGVDEHDVVFCVDDPGLAGRTAGTTRDEIVGELARLQDIGRDTTEELYCYFSGHGFCYTDIDGARVADALIASDYRNRHVSGGKCVRLDEMQKWLKLCMGPGHHFYFLDCCRNTVSEKDIKVGVLDLVYDRSPLGDPTVYTLLSVPEGDTARVGSGFASALVDGLNGHGRSKVWHGNAMAVLFDSVTQYVQTTLGQPVDLRTEGSGRGVIREFVPPPKNTFTILVEGARARDAFKVTIMNSRGDVVGREEFSGAQWKAERVPDDYDVRLVAAHEELVCLDALPVDLYEDATAHFDVDDRAQRGKPAPPRTSKVVVRTPGDARVVIRDTTLRPVASGDGVVTETLKPGAYTVDVLDTRNVPVAQRHVEVAPGESAELDLVQLKASPLRQALLASIPGDHKGGSVEFSETLGRTPDQQLDLWLAVIGAARIIRLNPDEFSKLRNLPLADFDQAPHDSCAFYVLAGFDDDTTAFAAAMGEGNAATAARPVPSHPALPGLHELIVDRQPPGIRLLSLQVGASSTMTLPVCSLPNRVTLITVSLDDTSRVRIQQFVLPMGHVMVGLPVLPPRGLEPVRRVVEIQRQFAESREFTDLFSASELRALLDVKWFEPISAILAAYELARRGHHDALRTALSNLRSFFDGLPDIEAIAALVGDPRFVVPKVPPLVLDGLLALSPTTFELPLPPEQLDFRGPWTVWRGAV